MVRPIGPERYGDEFRRIATLEGPPPIRIHNLRHSIASIQHASGVAPVTVGDAAKLLGHSLAVHVVTYVKSSEAGVDRAAAAFAEAIAEAQ